MSDYTLHGFVVFVFFCPIRIFPTCAITKIIAHLSMGVNVLTLNKYMIRPITKVGVSYVDHMNDDAPEVDN